MKIGQALYQQGEAGGETDGSGDGDAGGAQGDAKSDAKSDEGVVDADFEEVDDDKKGRQA
jgi:molecular chaperone DnaK